MQQQQQQQQQQQISKRQFAFSKAQSSTAKNVESVNSDIQKLIQKSGIV